MLIPALLLAVSLTFGGYAGQDTYRLAYDTGFSDGYESGRQDRGKEKPFDFANKVGYQEALRGFDDSRYDRDVYIVAYRRGFEDGYEDGYGLSEANIPQDAASSSGSLSRNPLVLNNPGGGSTPTSEATIPSGTRFKVRLLDTLGTQHNERGDTFRAEAAEDVEVGDQILIPEGTNIRGTVTRAKRPGRIKGRAEMDLRFDEIIWPDGSSVLIDGTVLAIEERADEKVEDDEGTIRGKGSKSGDAKKVGVTSGIGALIGILAGGGAKTGAITGAIGGLAGVLATRGSDILLYSHTELSIRLNGDVSVPVDPTRHRVP